MARGKLKRVARSVLELLTLVALYRLRRFLVARVHYRPFVASSAFSFPRTNFRKRIVERHFHGSFDI